MKNHTPPSDEQMETIRGLRGQFDWEDVITWQQEVGLKKGIIYEETGDISFDEWPTAPHEPLILEFTKSSSNSSIHRGWTRHSIQSLKAKDHKVASPELSSQLWANNANAIDGYRVRRNNPMLLSAQIHDRIH